MMKSTLKILFVLIFASGCNASKTPVEDQLFNCLIKEYQKQGVDIIPLLDSLENHYINHGILKNNSGEAKLEYYSNIANEGKVPSMDYYHHSDSVAQIQISQSEISICISENGIDSLALKQSNYYKLMENFKSMTEVNPKNAAKAHVDILNSSDLEHPYYRAHMLITFTRIHDRNSAYIRN